LNLGFSGGLGGFGNGHLPTDARSFNRTSDVVARALLHSEPLRLGFVGSSVMCGHDNCYRNSFPSQLAAFVGDAFASAQAPVEVRNACQGGECGGSYQSQIFCVRNMVGDDADMLFYEWTYFETDRDVEWYHETLVRWLARLPKAPPLVIFNCDSAPWSGSDGVNARLLDAYAAFGANGISLGNGLREGNWTGVHWGETGDGIHREPRNGANGQVFVNWRACLGPLPRARAVVGRATHAEPQQTPARSGSSTWPT